MKHAPVHSDERETLQACKLCINRSKPVLSGAILEKTSKEQKQMSKEKNDGKL